MADITIDAAAIANTVRAPRSLVYVSSLVGYMFFIDADSDFKYLKTSDGGATWGGSVTVKTGVVTAFDVWFDGWTSGDAGTIIHTWYAETDADDVFYRSLDTSTDTLGTEQTVFAGVSGTSAYGVMVSGTKARGGNLFCYFNIDQTAETGFYRSTDSGATWGVRTNLWEAHPDLCILYPGNEADNQDIWALYNDASVNELTLKVHDDSADTNSESASIATLIESAIDVTGQYQFSGATRHSDGHLIVAVWTDRDTATCDARVFDINGTASITELTAIATDKDDTYYPAVCINQATNDIYVAYIGKIDGSETLGTAAGVYYVKSSDGGTTWGAETVYSVSVTDYFSAKAPLSGPRFAVAWRDASTEAVVTNFDNSVVLTAAEILLELLLGGELQLLGAELLGTTTLALLLVGEGSFAADLTLDRSMALAMRGELQLATPTLDLSTQLGLVLRGEGGFTQRGGFSPLGFSPLGFSTIVDTSLNLQVGSYLGLILGGEGSFTAALSAGAASEGGILLALSLRGEGGFAAGLGLNLPGLTMAADEHVGILFSTITVDEVNNAPNTSKCVAIGVRPEVGQSYRLRYGEFLDAGVRFRGHVLSTSHYYEDNNYRHLRTTVNAIDVTWRLMRRRITKRYYNRSATDIIKDIILPCGFTTTHVAEGLPTIKDIAFNNIRRDEALTQVMEQIGGQWRVDVGLGTDDFIVADVVGILDDPEPLTPTHSSLKNFRFSEDIGSIMNRLLMTGASATVQESPSYEYETSAVILAKKYGAPRGATRIYLDAIEREMPNYFSVYDAFGNPVGDGVPQPPQQLFSATGGQVITSDGHILSYTGTGVHTFFIASGGYEMPLVELITVEGEGITPGWHSYYVTITTQWGESTWRVGGQSYNFLAEGPNAARLIISGKLSPEIRAVNIYRTKIDPDNPLIKPEAFHVGSVPGPRGGTLIDDKSDENMTQLLPTEDQSARQPQSYLTLSTPLLFPIRAGETLSAYQVFEDLSSQAYLREKIGGTDDGVVEDEITDSSLAHSEMQPVAATHLKLRATPTISASWDSFDKRAKPGRIQSINMPDLVGQFRIQSVKIEETEKGVPPTLSATATNRLFTLEHLLKQRKGK